MAPLARHRVRTGDRPAAHHDTAADSGAQNDPEHRAGSRAGAVNRLGQREAVGVVGQAHRPPDARGEILRKWLAYQPGRVGVLDETGGWRHRTGNADADCAGDAYLGFARQHEIRQNFDRCRVIALWRGDAPARHDSALVGKHSRLDFRAAEIQSNPHDFLSILLI